MIHNIFLEQCPLKAGLVKDERFSTWIRDEEIKKKDYVLPAGGMPYKTHTCNCMAIYKGKDGREVLIDFIDGKQRGSSKDLKDYECVCRTTEPFFVKELSDYLGGIGVEESDV